MLWFRDVHYMFGERHYMGSEIFTTLVHYYVVKELCGDVHHKGSDHYYLVFTAWWVHDFKIWSFFFFWWSFLIWLTALKVQMYIIYTLLLVELHKQHVCQVFLKNIVIFIVFMQSRYCACWHIMMYVFDIIKIIHILDTLCAQMTRKFNRPAVHLKIAFCTTMNHFIN